MIRAGEIIADETVEANCPTHGNYTAEVFRAGSLTSKSGCPACYEERAAAQQHEEARRGEDRKRERIKANRVACGLPERFIPATFDQYEAGDDGQKRALQTATAFAGNFDDIAKRGCSLTMLGTPGTGKTHLAAAIANKILDSGRSVFYRTAYGLLREIKSSWRPDPDQTETEIIARYAGADLLILDEVGVQFGSETEKVLLFEVLNTRYAELKPTVIISNLDEKGLAEFLGARIFDRLAESGSAVLAFRWGSYRTTSKLRGK